jgi:hypothetical protein
MKKYKMSKRIFNIILLAFFIAAGQNKCCGFEKSTIFQDNTSRIQINLLNNKLIQSLKENNSNQLLSLFSDNLKRVCANSTDAIVNKVHPFIKTSKFSILGDFQISNRNYGKYETLNNPLSDSAYRIRFIKSTIETHVSLIVPAGENDQVLLICIYGKYNGVWKLDILDIGEYKIFGIGPADYYKQARKDYFDKNLIGAKLNRPFYLCVEGSSLTQPRNHSV